ncbi:hypothetical protein STANM309S_02337 [Streptomyces tanashiensis]
MVADLLDDPGHLGAAVPALDLQEHVPAAPAQVVQLGGEGRDAGPGVGGAEPGAGVQGVHLGGGQRADLALDRTVLTWKAAVFIAVMCCALAALLGVLVHVSVTGQT